MAFSVVPTVAVGELLPIGFWNTNIRANMEHFAGTHDHGSASHGALTLGGTGGLTHLRLTDGSDADAPGAGKTVFYSKSGKMWQRAGAAGR